MKSDTIRELMAGDVVEVLLPENTDHLDSKTKKKCNFVKNAKIEKAVAISKTFSECLIVPCRIKKPKHHVCISINGGVMYAALGISISLP